MSVLMACQLQRDFPVVGRKRWIGGVYCAPSQFARGIFIIGERLGSCRVQEHGAVARRLSEGIVDLDVRV